MKYFSVLVLTLFFISAVVTAPLKKSKTGTSKKLLLISFDGFRWNYDQDVNTPNLDYLAEVGVKAKYINPPYITMTSPSHFSMITGRYIEEHGVIHNLMFNTETLQKLTFKATQNRSEWWDNGAEPMWITAQKQGKRVGSFHYPGGGANYSGQSIYRTLVESFDHPDSNETEWRENIDIVMNWFTKENFDFVTLYYGEPDQVGHSKGPETQERRDMIVQIDRTIGYLLEAIERHGLKDDLNVIITSDHGMTTVKKDPAVKEILLSKYIKFRDLVKFDIVDYGGFGMILPKEGKEEQLYQALKNAHPYLSVYRKDDMPKRFHVANNPRILPILLFAGLGYNLNGRVIIYVNKGDHSFDHDFMDMKTIFRAFGPDFKKNYVAEPFDNIHVYELMCRLLAVEPAPNSGSLSHTEDMLVESLEEGPTEPDTSGKVNTNGFVAAMILTGIIAVTLVVFITSVPYIVHKRNKRKEEECVNNDMLHTGNQR
ncbi:ectonucleotide pyrophosphatase/phosphodiesterase family member 7-like [Protopterus annectens]|uniref:ectonucleotide pyrophosphatase/phosphodiesterase family member 7-like n=1 Tax=Protopterus annectens TaxID=7888 RepID=UPI001CF95B96|nr:ectonucleotide pyrophosphatase/phosphodiesterase family member 7-like [Protopterus annectens]